jgi:tetratricopeptide (TPR) repeat protein
MKRTTLWIVSSLVVVAAVAGLVLHRIRENRRARIETESIPARPAFSGFPTELENRVADCERDIRAGTAGVRPLADLGQLYQANGFLPEAAKCYRGLMVLEPDNPHWTYHLAGMSADAGLLEEAIRLWRQVVTRAPSYLPAPLRIADALLKLNRPDEATAAYTRVLAADADNPYALLGLARLDLASGHWEDARSRLETAAAKTGGAIGGDLLVSVYEHLGEADKAAGLRSKAKSSGAYYAVPDPWTAEIYEFCYDDHQLTNLGGLTLQAGDTALARHWLERAVAVAPHSMQANFQLGLLERQSGDPTGARQYLEACTRFAPEFTDGWAQLVDLLMTQGDLASADQVLAEGLQHCPQSSALHRQHAQRLTAAGLIDQAIAEYQEVTRLSPEVADSFVALAKLYFKLGQTDKGVGALRQALASEPEYPPAIATLALYSIETGDEPAAREWMAHVRMQVRIPRTQVESLAGRYRAHFGRDPW